MDINEKNLLKLQKLLSLMDSDTLTKEDFVKAFEQVVVLIKKIEKKNMDDFQNMMMLVNTLSQKLTEKTDSSLSEYQKKIMDHCMSETGKMMEECKNKMYEMDDKMLEIRDGKDADEEIIVGKIVERLEIPKIEDLENNIPALGTRIRDSLELLQGEERLDISAIKGLEDVKKEGKEIKIIGGARGIYLYVDGVKYGIANMLNLIGGAGVTLTYNRSGGRNDVTISAVSGAFTVLTATGDVDDSNVTFTFLAEPAIVVVNGATYRDGHGCSISGTTVTLDNPVGTGGDIYGLG